MEDFSVITSGFGWRKSPFNKYKTEFHSGTDFATGGKKIPIYSVADGIIIYSGWKKGYGKLVIIEHTNVGVKTYYGHMSSIYVHKGQSVKKSDVLGKTGNTGRSTGIHLHFEVRWLEKETDSWVILDPLLFI